MAPAAYVYDFTLTVPGGLKHYSLTVSGAGGTRTIVLSAARLAVASLSPLEPVTGSAYRTECKWDALSEVLGQVTAGQRSHGQGSVAFLDHETGCQ
jgi:hypothetical protein